MNNLYYRPSGKVNPLSILYLLLAICVAVPILALIYTYAILYIPLIYLNFLCVAGVAFGLGFIASFVMDLGKVRNVLIAALFGLLIGIAGLYTSWIIWLAHHYEQEYMDIAFNMEALFAEIEYANEQGTWGIGRSGGLVNGTMLSIVWVIEAVGMIGFPVFFAYSKACEPFIENDDSWAELTPIGPFEFILNKEELKQQLETRNYETLVNMPVANSETDASHSIFQLHHGKHINQAKEFYLSVVNMKAGTDKDGNLKFDENNLINYIHITKEAGQQLVARISNTGTEAKANSV
ncbi:hypothetical protein [Kordia jejudonensis]|uniref:hypothetical protein n=1 Tax=Kordia jejudonensis TaxID=1348245 RepID=UPI0006290AC7|nr:hypothetical protein [Kordia jejudonensis]